MTFTPSEKFGERWLNSPKAMKQTIFAELNDIITLLQDDTRLDQFEFQTPDLHATLSHLQTAHLETLTTMTQKLRQERADALLPILEQQLEQRLQQKISERLAGLDDELKAWIKQAIQEELSKAVVLSY